MRWSRVLNVVDVHAGGEVNKVITGGVGDVPGHTMFDKRLYLEEHLDQIRHLMLFEPRGAVHHCANIILPSNHPEAALGYVILEPTEYPAMSGSNTICVATTLLETGMLPMTEPVTELVLEAPAGLIRLHCTCKDGKVTAVRFTNQPAFVHRLGVPVEVPGRGTLTVDVAYGGMTYALVDARSAGFALTPDEAHDLCVAGQEIKAAAAEQIPVTHPGNPQIAGITQTEFTGPVTRDAGGRLTAVNAVVVSPGRIDRSACGTGTCARLAVMYARGEIAIDEPFVHTSLIGTPFESWVRAETMVGHLPAVVPDVAGQAWITGLHQVGLDPTDPFPNGFTLNDTWLQAI
ncbi:MAG: proline racemase family protein [Chloroflexota bacterium]